MTPLDALVDVVAGRPVLVAGSAPLDAPLAPSPATVRWGVNGGISSLPEGSVDVWNVNARDFAPHAKEQLHAAMIAQGKGRHVRLAVLNVREESSVETFLKRAKANNVTIDAWLAYNTLERDRLLVLTGGLTQDMSRHAPSAGMLSAALACFCGGRPVTLAGFSWKPGYQYLPGVKVHARGHVSIDKMVLGNLLRRYPGALEHTLELPRRYWTKEEFMGAVNDEVTKDIETARAIAVRVRAVKAGIYGVRRLRPGEEFTLSDPKHFKKSWMVPVVADEVPVQDAVDEVIGDRVRERIRDVGEEAGPNRAMERARRNASSRTRRPEPGIPFGQGGKLPELELNGADLKQPTPADDKPTGDQRVLE